MKDIVYILKNRSRDEYAELRYSLRSLKNIPHERVFIVGGHPSWIKNVEWLPGVDRYPNKQLNAVSKIMVACECEEVSNDFILMNDDFYILEPTEVPYLTKGKLKQTVKDFDYIKSKYWYAMDRTAKLFRSPDDFETHFPIVFNKKKFLELFDKYDYRDIYLFRSLYGNEYRVKSETVEDRKAYNITKVREMTRGPFFSTADPYTHSPAFYKIMHGLFPERSEYE